MSVILPPGSRISGGFSWAGGRIPAVPTGPEAPPASLRVGSVLEMILAIDQGTTGTTCIVFGDDGRPAGRSYREFTQHFPRPGWVEHDAAEIWEVSRAVAGEAVEDAGIEATDLRAIGITNQRETVVAWDRRTG